MATAKKKPTAKQVAARKLFVQRVRSGEFAKAKPKPAKRKKNPVARSRSGNSHASEVSTRKVAVKRALQRKANPAKKSVVRERAINPAHRAPVGFAVHRANADGKPGALIARFPGKADAVEYARAFAKSHNRAVVIVGKGV